MQIPDHAELIGEEVHAGRIIPRLRLADGSVVTPELPDWCSRLLGRMVVRASLIQRKTSAEEGAEHGVSASAIRMRRSRRQRRHLRLLKTAAAMVLACTLPCMAYEQPIAWDAPTHYMDGSAITQQVLYRLYYGQLSGGVYSVMQGPISTLTARATVTATLPAWYAVAAVCRGPYGAWLESGLSAELRVPPPAYTPQPPSQPTTRRPYVRFSCHAVPSGVYSLMLRSLPATSRAPAVRVTVSHLGGIETLLVDQRPPDSAMIYLGEYAMRPADWVEVSTEGATGQVIADAVRLYDASRSTTYWISCTDATARVYGVWSTTTNGVKWWRP